MFMYLSGMTYRKEAEKEMICYTKWERFSVEREKDELGLLSFKGGLCTYRQREIGIVDKDESMVIIFTFSVQYINYDCSAPTI